MTKHNQQHQHAQRGQPQAMYGRSFPGQYGPMRHPPRYGPHAYHYLTPKDPGLTFPPPKLVLNYANMRVGLATEMILLGTDVLNHTWKRFKNLFIPSDEDDALHSQKIILSVGQTPDDPRNSRGRQGVAPHAISQQNQATLAEGKTLREWIWK